MTRKIFIIFAPLSFALLTFLLSADTSSALSSSVVSPSPPRRPTILLCDVPDSVLPVLSRYESIDVVHVSNIDDETLIRRLELDNDDDVGVDAFVVRSSNTVSSEAVERLQRRKSSLSSSSSAPHVRVIGRAGAGCDNIDLEACRAAGLEVVTAAGANAPAVAEHALGLMLALGRRFKPCVTSVADGRWERASLTGTGLRGRTVGVIGFGAIGFEVASVCSKLGMRVLVAPSSYAGIDDGGYAELRRRRLEDSGAEVASDVDDVFRRSDYVSVHLPLADDTRRCIGARQFELMKPGSFFISTGRGGVIDEEALLGALKKISSGEGSGGIAGAALDVFQSEGPDVGKDKVLMELANMDSVIITPHIGGHTVEAQADVWTTVIDRVLEKLHSYD